MIFVDTNPAETPLFKELEMLLEEESVGRKPLVIGDVLVEDDENNAVFSFEVKRGNDWGASILDGLKNQGAQAQDSELCGKFSYIYEENAEFWNEQQQRNAKWLSDAAVYGSIVRIASRQPFVLKQKTQLRLPLLARVFRDFQKDRFSQVRTNRVSLLPKTKGA